MARKKSVKMVRTKTVKMVRTKTVKNGSNKIHDANVAPIPFEKSKLKLLGTFFSLTLKWKKNIDLLLRGTFHCDFFGPGDKNFLEKKD
jgi:hypothetical protein